MKKEDMLNLRKEPRGCRIPAFRFKALITASIMLVLAFQSACFFSKKRKPETVVATSSVKVVLLPFNVPQSNQDIRWAALAAPILMAETGLPSKNLDLIPIWQAMPFAIENGGVSRTFTPDAAVNVANWMSAKWVVMGELTPTKTGFLMTVDFLPARSTMIPFRFQKKGKLETVSEGFHDAYNQFFRYLVARPLPQERNTKVTLGSYKDLAETLDREYGWFASAEPGKATEAVAGLKASNEALARYLFSPDLYPSLTQKKEK